MKCPCGGERYKKCCYPFHKNKKKPKTPLELMKSRYSAYALGEVKYIIKTQIEKTDIESIKSFCNSEFKKLEIIDYYDNIVEFKAYIDDYILHERSEFVFEDGWKYLKGEIYEN